MKLSTAWNWQLGIGILEDNVFGQPKEPPPPDMDLLAEKRREARISLSLPVRYREKGRGVPWFPAQSVDVSRNGVRLALDHKVTVGTRVDLDIKLPEVSDTVRLEGVIVWAHPSRNGTSVMECGIAFKNLRQLTHREQIMYFMADKICSLAERNARNFGCRPAVSVADLQKAYSLVYREYLAKGYCEESQAKMHYNIFSLLPSSKTFMLEKNDNFVGTISLIPDSPCGLPLDTIFKEEIDTFRRSGRKLAEVGLLALDGESFERNTFSLTDFQKLTGSFRLFKIMFDHARTLSGVTDLVIGMHPKHRELYRYLLFEDIGPVKSYPGARGKPALLMHMDIDRVEKTTALHRGVGSYFLRNVMPQKTLMNHYTWEPAAVLDFLKWRDMLPKLSHHQKEYLRFCYPDLQLPEP